MKAATITPMIATIGNSGTSVAPKPANIVPSVDNIVGENKPIIKVLNTLIALTTLAKFLNIPPNAVINGPPKYNANPNTKPPNNLKFSPILVLNVSKSPDNNAMKPATISLNPFVIFIIISVNFSGSTIPTIKPNKPASNPPVFTAP